MNLNTNLCDLYELMFKCENENGYCFMETTDQLVCKYRA